MAAKRFAASVLLRHPDTGAIKHFVEGDAVPDWAKVGAHVTSGGDDPAPQQQPGEDAFDPSEHSVEEVAAYLAEADDAEIDRVKAAEAEGKGRKTIAGWQPAPGEESN